MPDGPEMRLPYGPGWEDPDWAPHAPTAAPAPAVAKQPLPCVSSLAEFMAVVQQAAGAPPGHAGWRVAPVSQREPVAGTAAYVGQTRRWVIASGAGLLALSTLPMPHEANAPSPPGDPEPGRVAGEASQQEMDGDAKAPPPRAAT
jgi:hypothetical protein